MEWLFGKKVSPDEMLRKNQRALNKAMRDLDREKMKMEQQEKKIIADIKKLAKEGQMEAVKIMAKDLVRTRRYTKKFMLMKANIQAVSLKIQTLKSQNTMSEAMKGKPLDIIPSFGIKVDDANVFHPLPVPHRCYESNAKYEQAAESAANTKDSARIRETIGNNGYEGGDD